MVFWLDLYQDPPEECYLGGPRVQGMETKHKK